MTEKNIKRKEEKKMKDSKFLYYNLKLNQEYFLITSNDEWILTRNKFVFYKVMNSNDNTEEQLKQFIKEHTTYDYQRVIGIISIFLSIAMAILSIINMKYKTAELTFFVYGACSIILIECFVRMSLNSHNRKVLNKIYEEDMEFFKKKERELKNELDGIEKEKE